MSAAARANRIWSGISFVIVAHITGHPIHLAHLHQVARAVADVQRSRPLGIGVRKMDPADPVAALVFQHVDVRIDGFLERAFDMRARSLRRFPRGLAVERLKCDGADAVPAGIPPDRCLSARTLRRCLVAWRLNRPRHSQPRRCRPAATLPPRLCQRARKASCVPWGTSATEFQTGFSAGASLRVSLPCFATRPPAPGLCRRRGPRWPRCRTTAG